MPEQDYYKALRDENYKTLLDREIQLDNARQRAFQNANASLAASGLESSGYGQLAKQGIEGQYLQALGQANNDYAQANLQKQNENFNYLSELLGSVGTEDERNAILGNYGLLNDDGTINNELVAQRYGAESPNQLSGLLTTLGGSLIDNSSNGVISILQNSGITSEKQGFNANQLGKLSGNGSFINIPKDLTNKLKEFENNAKDGEIFMIKGGFSNSLRVNGKSVNNDDGNAYVMYYNGKLYFINKGNFAKVSPSYTWSTKNNEDYLKALKGSN